MSAGSPKFTVRRIAALSLVSLWLAGCSDTSNPPAPVYSTATANSAGTAATNSGYSTTANPASAASSSAAGTDGKRTNRLQPSVWEHSERQL